MFCIQRTGWVECVSTTSCEWLPWTVVWVKVVEFKSEDIQQQNRYKIYVTLKIAIMQQIKDTHSFIYTFRKLSTPSSSTLSIITQDSQIVFILPNVLSSFTIWLMMFQDDYQSLLFLHLKALFPNSISVHRNFSTRFRKLLKA